MSISRYDLSHEFEYLYLSVRASFGLSSNHALEFLEHILAKLRDRRRGRIHQKDFRRERWRIREKRYGVFRFVKERTSPLARGEVAEAILSLMDIAKRCRELLYLTDEELNSEEEPKGVMFELCAVLVVPSHPSSSEDEEGATFAHLEEVWDGYLATYSSSIWL